MNKIEENIEITKTNSLFQEREGRLNIATNCNMICGKEWTIAKMINPARMAHM